MRGSTIYRVQVFDIFGALADPASELALADLSRTLPLGWADVAEGLHNAPHPPQ